MIFGVLLARHYTRALPLMFAASPNLWMYFSTILSVCFLIVTGAACFKAGGWGNGVGVVYCLYAALTLVAVAFCRPQIQRAAWLLKKGSEVVMAKPVIVKAYVVMWLLALLVFGVMGGGIALIWIGRSEK